MPSWWPGKSKTPDRTPDVEINTDTGAGRPSHLPTGRPGDRSATPADDAPSPATHGTTDAATFLAQLQATAPRQTGGRGRLIFAMDATMSRQPTWDMALGLQADMFSAVKSVGGLDVQLVFFRGSGECRSSKWVRDPEALARLMTQVRVAGGFTQIGKVLSHARKEAERERVHALVYVGDATEENIDELCGRAGELAVHGVPVFAFQEGRDPNASRAFGEIARLTKGAHCRFDSGSAAELRALLSAVAVYAAGGRAALEARRTSGEAGAQLLLEHMDGRGKR